MSGCLIPKPKPTGRRVSLKCTRVTRKKRSRDTSLSKRTRACVWARYLPRVLQVEKGTFTPAVFITSGGMGKEADRLLRYIRRMAKRMSIKRGENYSSVVSFLRRRFRFDLLKTCVIEMRGYKKPTTTAAKIDTLELDLRTTASSC